MCLHVCYIDRERSKGNLGKQKQIVLLKDIKNVFNLEKCFFLDLMLSCTINIWLGYSND